MKKNKTQFINLDYKECINKIKIEQDLKELEITIKDLVSQDITCKFKKKRRIRIKSKINCINIKAKER